MNNHAPQSDPLVGLTVARVRPMSDKELAREGWDGESAVIIEFDDGSSLHAMRDPEGNGPGVIIHNVGDQSFYIFGDAP